MNPIPILYQNDEIYIINKPAGLSVQGGEKISHSLDEEFAKQTGSKVYLVHRLDKDTAGLMVVAKNSVAAGKWTKLINQKIVKKEYIAVCCGIMNPKKGQINESLVQHGEIKNAVTDYTVEKEDQTKILTGEDSTEEKIINLSTIRLHLQTGRMHQIRIHLAKKNCPIAGDDQHGNFKLNKLLRKHLKIKQLLLASVKLTVPVIENGKEIVKTFEIDLPDFMKISV